MGEFVEQTYIQKILKRIYKQLKKEKQIMMLVPNRSYQLLLFCSTFRSTCFAIDKNDFALFCISVVRCSTPCQVIIRKYENNYKLKFSFCLFFLHTLACAKQYIASFFVTLSTYNIPAISLCFPAACFLPI